MKWEKKWMKGCNERLREKDVLLTNRSKSNCTNRSKSNCTNRSKSNVRVNSTCGHLFSYSSAEINDSVSISVYSKATVLLFPLPTTHLVKSVHSFASWCLWISASFIIGFRLIRSIFFDSTMYIAYHIKRRNVTVIIYHHRRLLIGQPSWSRYL